MIKDPHMCSDGSKKWSLLVLSVTLQINKIGPIFGTPLQMPYLQIIHIPDPPILLPFSQVSDFVASAICLLTSETGRRVDLPKLCFRLPSHYSETGKLRMDKWRDYSLAFPGPDLTDTFLEIWNDSIIFSPISRQDQEPITEYVE